MTEAVRVRLFGREYSVKGHGDKRYVQTLAEFIRERADIVQRHGTVVSTLDLVVLTLLNITDELFQYKLVKEQTIKELEEKTEKLLEAIDRTI
ncbi:MAG: cell division protein ZapA [Desulfomonile tiedjei]|uniref:Cell division protein ZapA n=1 Tax=Desulfomonile tiedjei TaxID=2358 RepID=A0A9D6V5D5_9BACT|nr:cell division protein ZapA [Desulfomonile tiedjei]